MSYIMTPSGCEGMKKYGWRDLNKSMTCGTEMVNGELCVSYIRPPVDDLIKQLAEPTPEAEMYVYQNLPPGCVRLLRRIDAGTQLEPTKVVFEFVVCSLEDASKPPPQYSAISYCWGDLPVDHHLVFHDRSYIRITKKVARILARIAADVDHIWIDAVCINQADLAEKALQIPLMADIYRKAGSVELWLGKQEGIPRILSPTDQNQSTSQNAQFFVDYDSGRHDPFTPYSHANVVDLIWSPWFERAWVVQEFFFGRELRYHFGDVVLYTLFFDTILKDLKTTGFVDHDKGQLQIPRPPMLRNFHKFRGLRNILTQPSDEHGPSHLAARLEDVLCEFYGLKATDPRDKVYAMLNFVGPTAREDIKPDYTRHAADVYHDTMKSVLFRGTTFRLLGFAGLVAPRPLFHDLPNTPSWVPDLSAAPEHTVWSADTDTKATAPLSGNKGVCLQCFHSIDGREIAACFQGKTIDAPGVYGLARSYKDHRAFIVPHGKHIATVTEVLAGNPSHNLVHLPGFLSSAIQMTEKHCKVPTVTAKDMLRKTLIAEDQKSLAADPDGEGFDQLCDLLFTATPRGGNKGKDEKNSKKSPGTDDITGKPPSPIPLLWARDTPHSKARSYVETMLQEGTGSTRGLFWTVSAPSDNKNKRNKDVKVVSNVGLAANGVQPGDEVWLLVGAMVPFILRPRGRCRTSPDLADVIRSEVLVGEGLPVDSELRSRGQNENATRDDERETVPSTRSFYLVCEAYVHGIMHSEMDITRDSEPFLLF